MNPVNPNSRFFSRPIRSWSKRHQYVEWDLITQALWRIYAKRSKGRRYKIYFPYADPLSELLSRHYEEIVPSYLRVSEGL
mgnify:CR=1 FL=1